MDIRQLRYFLAIAEEGQISGAAKRLHIAQPPLSQQLKLMEAELGVQLVERTNRNTRLTEAGRALRHRAEQIIDLMNITTKEIQAIDEGAKGTLALGTIASLGSTLLPGWISSFHAGYPGIDFLLWEGETERIIDLLSNGVIEIGLVRLPVDPAVLESIPLPKEPLVAAMNSKWAIAGDNPIPIAELAGKPLLIHRRHMAMITKSCREAGFEPVILCKADDPRSMLAWADAGIGIAIATSSMARLLASRDLHYREIVAPGLETAAAVVWMRNRYLSIAARHFLQLFSTNDAPSADAHTGCRQ